MARRALPLLLLALTVACATSDVPPADVPPADDDDSAVDDDDSVQDDDDAVQDDDDATPSDPTCAEGADNLDVLITQEPGRDPVCQDEVPWLCVDGYDAFFDHPETWLNAAPLEDCAGFVDQLIAWAQSGGAPSEQDELPPETDPGAEILARTGMEFLFEPHAFAARPLSVAVVGETQRTSDTGAAYRQLELVLEDEFVGEIQALLLLPAEGEGPFPTVLALPGHVEGAEEHRDLRFGQFFPENGFALMILDLRAWEQPWDHDLSVEMLCSGFHMMTLHAYEAMVAFKFLLASPLACNGRLGLIGHSGGSIAGGLLAWLEDTPARAFVTDGYSGFFNVDESEVPEQPWVVDCETHLGLRAISERLNAFDEAPVPTRIVPYAYAEDFDGPEPAPDDLAALDWFIPFFRERLQEP